MADERDKYKPKHTPAPGGVRPVKPGTYPSGVPAFSSQVTVDASAQTAELARREREASFESETPVHGGDPSTLLAFRTYDRAKSASIAADSTLLEVATLKADNTNLRELVMSLANQVSTLNGSVQTLTTETQAQRAERVDRERRQETRAEADAKREADRALLELEAKRARTRQILSIWIPTITALAALVVGIITALRDPNVKYVPMVPNTPTPTAPSGTGVP